MNKLILDHGIEFEKTPCTDVRKPDVERIIQACAKCQLEIDFDTAYTAWQCYSWAYFHSTDDVTPWLPLPPTSRQIVNWMKPFVRWADV